MKDSQGVTLLEAVVVLSMMIGLMVLITMFFVRGQRYATASEAYSSLQREATLTLSRITDEIYRGSSRHIVFGEDNKAVIFLSYSPNEPVSATDKPVEFDDSAGRIVWKKWVCFFHDEARREVRRVEVPLESTTVDLTAVPAPEPLFSVFESSVSQRSIGKNVREFLVLPNGTSLSVSLRFQSLMPLALLNENQKNIDIDVSMEVNLIN